MSSSPDVIVVGAGVSGLAAATALSEQGARVLVLEARGTPGGRTSSFRDRTDGAWIDNGQHVVLGCYRETFSYLERIGAAADIPLYPALEVPGIDHSGRANVLRCPAWPSPWNLLAGLVTWSAIGWKDRLAARHIMGPLRSAQTGARDPRDAQETVASWLSRCRQSPRLIELLWEPLALAALNQPITHAAAETFVEVLGRVFGPGPRDASIGLPARPLAHTFGTAAIAYLEERGSELRCHAPARLVVEAGRLWGVAVRGSRIRAPFVVAALPWTRWATFVAEADAERAGLSAIRDAASRTASSAIVTVNLWLDRPVLTSRFVGLPGRRFHWVFAHDTVGGRAGACRVSLVASGADSLANQSAAMVVQHAIDDLRQAVPGAAQVRVLRSLVVREPCATFSLAPGQPARPGVRTPLEGLFLAGDWTATGLPATIEGAAQSGHAAAAAVVAAETARDSTHTRS
ncbi:MAG: hydroxysqualene dehydroxylase HpnE [Vicinamibacterales bacterium]